MHGPWTSTEPWDCLGAHLSKRSGKLGAKRLSKIIQTGVYIHSNEVNARHYMCLSSSAAGGDDVRLMTMCFQ